MGGLTGLLHVLRDSVGCGLALGVDDMKRNRSSFLLTVIAIWCTCVGFIILSHSLFGEADQPAEKPKHSRTTRNGNSYSYSDGKNSIMVKKGLRNYDLIYIDRDTGEGSVFLVRDGQMSPKAEFDASGYINTGKLEDLPALQPKK